MCPTDVHYAVSPLDNHSRSSVKMRIGCLQFSPQVGDIENNLNRADAVLSKANPDELDLLVLPELAFSGMCAQELAFC